MATTTSADGTTIAYDRTGAGPALIVVAGAFSDRRSMAPYAAAFADDFSVYNYDRRGRGESGDTAPYAIAREVEDLAAMVEITGDDACVFAGSSGAALALDAVQAGVRIRKLALHEPPFVVDDSRPPVPDGLVADLSAMIAAGRRGDAAEAYLTVGAAMPAGDVAAMRAAPFWADGVEAVAHTLVYDAKIMDGTMRGQPLPADRWSRVRVPTLVTNGTGSYVWADAAAAALASLLPNVERVTFAGEQHNVTPATVAPAVTKFLLS